MSKITYDYFCDSCGDITTNQEMDSFACLCGGKYRLKEAHTRHPSLFEPHYSPEIGQWVESWKDAEKKAKAYRSESYPNGLIVTQSKTKFMKEMKYLHKHREDYIQERYKASGHNYKPGSNTKFDDSTNTFIPRDSR